MAIGHAVRRLWDWITYHRHRSELAALRLAFKSNSFLAEFPIVLTMLFWWIVFSLPSVSFGMLGLLLKDSNSPSERLVGGILDGLTTVYAIPALVIAAPWAFRWYLIILGLSYGSPGRAYRKKDELLAAIKKAEAESGAI